MYAATGSSGRDLQAMNDEVRHLTERRAELEELELVAMLEQDPIDAELAALRERTAPLEDAGGGAPAPGGRRARWRSTPRCARRSAPGRPRRRSCRAALADRYETLRARLKGTGAARLVGSHCDGCHLELSSVEVEKIRALPPGEVATCEQCGRILVPCLNVLILVRHGESVANAQGLLLGRTDAELTDTGRVQADERSRAGAGTGGRGALEPAPPGAATRPSCSALGPAVAVDERWIEVDYGEFEGQPLGGIPAEVWQRWQRDRDFRPEGGETLAEVDRRIAAACEDLFAVDGAGARRPDGDVVVVSHVSPIKAAVAWALGTVDLYWRLHLRTASVTRIGWNRDAPILHGFNEVAVAPRRHVAPGSAGA